MVHAKGISQVQDRRFRPNLTLQIPGSAVARRTRRKSTPRPRSQSAPIAWRRFAYADSPIHKAPRRGSPLSNEIGFLREPRHAQTLPVVPSNSVQVIKHRSNQHLTRKDAINRQERMLLEESTKGGSYYRQKKAMVS